MKIIFIGRHGVYNHLRYVTLSKYFREENIGKKYLVVIIITCVNMQYFIHIIFHGSFCQVITFRK